MSLILIEKILNGIKSFILPSRLAFFIMLGFAFFKFLAPAPPCGGGEVLGATSNSSQDLIPQTVVLTTKTSFAQKEAEEKEPIPFDTKYQEDSDLEYGTEETLQEGKNGLKKLKYLITYWVDEEIDRQLLSTEIEDPVAKVISKGTKIVWRPFNTEAGKLEYWYKLRVWATKYDAYCVGCLGRTFSGTAVHKGVCAVDPKVIRLGTTFYVEGYGLCHAEDIGGAIKGNRIDLGYENAAEGAWRTGYTNIYLLDNPPY